MNEELDGWMIHGVLYTSIANKMGSLLFSYLATSQRIRKLQNLRWALPTRSYGENKERMKELGGTIFGYRQFLTEMSILWMSKTMDDIKMDIKRMLNVKFDIWDATNSGLPHLKEARKVRALGDVIKHNQAIIFSKESKSAAFLVNECKLQEGFEIFLLPLDIRRELGHVYVFLSALAEKLTGTPKLVRRIKTKKDLERIERLLLPAYPRIALARDRET